MKTFIVSLSVLCLWLQPATAQDSGSNDSMRIFQTFNTYLVSPWPDRQKLMTDTAWHDYAGDTLYSQQNEAIAALDQRGIRGFEFPKLPADYKPNIPGPALEAAIKEASRIRAAVVDELEKKLEGQLPKLLEEIAPSGKVQGNPSLVEIRLSDDGLSATAECIVEGISGLRIPMQFTLVNGEWRFNGKDESLWFKRARKLLPGKQPPQGPLRTL